MAKLEGVACHSSYNAFVAGFAENALRVGLCFAPVASARRLCSFLAFTPCVSLRPIYNHLCQKGKGRKSSRERPGEAEADAATATAERVGVAVRRAAALSVDVPASAPNDAARARGRRT